METTKQQKDPLFAGLAREARWLGLPINIFILFLFSAFFLFFGIKVSLNPSYLWRRCMRILQR